MRATGAQWWLKSDHLIGEFGVRHFTFKSTRAKSEQPVGGATRYQWAVPKVLRFALMN